MDKPPIPTEAERAELEAILKAAAERQKGARSEPPRDCTYRRCHRRGAGSGAEMERRNR